MQHWRIYRLPGSRNFWHVDSGENTPVINVLGYEINVPSHSVDIVDGWPRAWIALQGELHIVNKVAVFNRVKVLEPAIIEGTS